MKFMQSISMVSLFGLVLISVLAAEPKSYKGTQSEITQGLPDADPLLGSFKQPKTSPEEVNENIKQDEQVEREITQLKNQANGSITNHANRLRAGQAAWILGLIYLHGAGVPVNSGQAKQWFLRSAAYGQKISSAGLAWCGFDGCQGSPDLYVARLQAQLLLPVDRPRALYLFWLIEEKLRPIHELGGQSAQQSTVMVSPLLQQAADGGNIHAMLDLGIYWVQRENFKEALNWFDRASSDSDAAKANALWVRKHQEAQQSMSQPSPDSQGIQSAEALYNRARQFHRGDGVPVNYAEAIRIYRNAEHAGSSKAKKILSLIFSRIGPDGNIDLIWMRQLSEMDISSAVPKQDEPKESILMKKEITPIIDLMPLNWKNRVILQSVK